MGNGVFDIVSREVQVGGTMAQLRDLDKLRLDCVGLLHTGCGHICVYISPSRENVLTVDKIGLDPVNHRFLQRVSSRIRFLVRIQCYIVRAAL